MEFVIWENIWIFLYCVTIFILTHFRYVSKSLIFHFNVSSKISTVIFSYLMNYSEVCCLASECVQIFPDEFWPAVSSFMLVGLEAYILIWFTGFWTCRGHSYGQELTNGRRVRCRWWTMVPSSAVSLMISWSLLFELFGGFWSLQMELSLCIPLLVLWVLIPLILKLYFFSFCVRTHTGLTWSLTGLNFVNCMMTLFTTSSKFFAPKRSF